MLHALDLLFDDRSGIEVAGDIMAGGADQFHSAIMGLPIGIGPDECRQETVMDVDQPAAIGLAEPIGEDLHESRQHGEFDVLFI